MYPTHTNIRKTELYEKMLLSETSMIDECDTDVMLLVAKLADMCLQRAIKQWSAKRVRIRFCLVQSDTKPQ